MSEPLYRPVDPQVSFPQLEERVQAWWKEHRIFRRTVEERKDCPEWVFYEGPPTANGKPGIHHVEARTFKDVFCRFHTMRGRYVYRKGGWDCHGLPVEVEVEKRLGIKNKREIEEKIGIEEFTRLCRESVKEYVADWEKLTDRIAFWLDMDDAYWTMDPDYVETVWWILRQIWDRGLLEEDFKVVPYCPRCETSLSNHEQHQTGAYQTVKDPSVYVRFPLKDDRYPDHALLVWTTTPWTLLSNMAAAVHPDLTYASIPDPDDRTRHLFIVKERLEPLFATSLEQLNGVSEVKGSDLVGLSYEPPFDFVGSGDKGHRVVPGAFVTTEDGTGIVHLAPYGEEDMEVAKRDGLPIVQMIDGSGRVVEGGGKFAGAWIKDADKLIIDDLKDRGLLFREEVYEHAYPHCWRCGTPLLYYARKDWYVRTSQIRDQLLESNEETNWQPPTIKYGRFGDWLANNVDWSLSRDRYWGTPLPIWRCEDEHATCIGSFAELEELSGRELNGFDPHRPYVDHITFDCPTCGKTATRVTSVIDTWFDSGSMPFGQWHYPFENVDVFDRRFPADFISEAIDQTRGWFYSLTAISTLVKGRNAYRNVVCLGHIVDGQGRKMSKSQGNIIYPMDIIDIQGADALRWYLLTVGTPWSTRRISAELIEEVLRKYLLTLWNTYAFWTTYASLENFDPTTVDIPVAERSELDRWILAELDDTVRVATRSLHDFDATVGGRRLDRFVDDLSNWYVRRSRRRFWKSGEDDDTKAAFLTLWECLITTTKLTAPYTPFVAEEIYTNLTGPAANAPESVHLADWPTPDDDRVDDALRASMRLVRRLVGLGRAARTEAKVRVRQPLALALLVMPAHEVPHLRGFERLVADELNLKGIELATGLEELVDYSVKPNFKTLGPRFGPKVKDVARALTKVDAHRLVAQIDSEGAATIQVDGEEVSLSRDDLDIRVEGRPGFALAQDGPYGVALDLEITPDLQAEGIAREVIRAIQDLRKGSGLAVEDRIQLWLFAADDAVRAALNNHSEFIASEVLAIALHVGEEVSGDAGDTVDVGGATVAISIRRS